MNYASVRYTVRSMVSQLGPHLPALAVFALVFLILNRLGVSSMVLNLIAPTILAVVTEMVERLTVK